jgi:hypothetical protein
MFHIQFPVGLSLVLALGTGSAVWTAKLDGKDGSKISGTAQVESPTVMPPSDTPIPPKDTIPADSTTSTHQSPNDLRVTLTVSNASPNASLSWYLYSGSCNAASAGDAESILGLPSSYIPIKVDGSGNGTAVTTVRGAQVGTGNFYVGILGGGKLVACGNLEPQASTGE